MGSPLADVVQNYAGLASSLLDRWSAHASNVAAKLDAGRYTAADAMADFATSASLATESGFLLASEAVDSVAILTGRQHEPHVVESDTFSTTLAGATLALAGPLANGHGSDALPVTAIRIEPPKLDPAATDFRLRADATGHRGATYVGRVMASTPGGSEPVIVWIVVP